MTEQSADAVRVKYYELSGQKLPGDIRYGDKAVSAPDVTKDLNALLVRTE